MDRGYLGPLVEGARGENGILASLDPLMIEQWILWRAFQCGCLGIICGGVEDTIL